MKKITTLIRLECAGMCGRLRVKGSWKDADNWNASGPGLSSGMHRDRLRERQKIGKFHLIGRMFEVVRRRETKDEGIRVVRRRDKTGGNYGCPLQRQKRKEFWSCAGEGQRRELPEEGTDPRRQHTSSH